MTSYPMSRKSWLQARTGQEVWLWPTGRVKRRKTPGKPVSVGRIVRIDPFPFVTVKPIQP